MEVWKFCSQTSWNRKPRNFTSAGWWWRPNFWFSFSYWLSSEYCVRLQVWGEGHLPLQILLRIPNSRQSNTHPGFSVCLSHSVEKPSRKSVPGPSDPDEEKTGEEAEVCWIKVWRTLCNFWPTLSRFSICVRNFSLIVCKKTWLTAHSQKSYGAMATQLVMMVLHCWSWCE